LKRKDKEMIKMTKVNFDKLVKKASNKRNSIVSTAKEVSKNLSGKNITKEMVYGYAQKD
jgi:hypothetical protein